VNIEREKRLGSTVSPASWARIERAWWAALILTILVFAAIPIGNLILGFPMKDYGLWYQVGLALRQGLNIYPRPETGRLFPFMYPPSAAAMLGWLSMLGQGGMLFALVIGNSLSWLACIALSIWLAVEPGEHRHPLVLIIPSLAIIVLIHNIYLLGQPNLLLLALLLAAFACLRIGRSVAAGAFVATAAAIKAFPILALGYLIYRRMWAASAATVAVLAAWLLVAPLAFRTPAQALDDVIVWSQGMVFTYNKHGIAQRPIRSYSYKNQSIMALAHRLLRDVPADGEAVLSRNSRTGDSIRRKPGGAVPLDPSVDLPAFLKSLDEPPGGSANRALTSEGRFKRTLVGADAASTGRAPEWSSAIDDAEPALRAAWRVNVANLGFDTVTAITLAVIVAICVFVAAVLPPANRRTRQTDAMEFAIVTLLTVMFSPLSFNYAYVWLLYPMTLAWHLVLSEPATAPWHRMKTAWIVGVTLIPALAVPMQLLAQAYGNLFVPALLLVVGFGAMLYTARRRVSDSAEIGHSVFKYSTRPSFCSLESSVP
jgi:hypothetical protein